MIIQQWKVNRCMDRKPDEPRTPFQKVFEKIPGIVTAKLTPDNTVSLEITRDFDWGKEGKKLLDQLGLLERAIGQVSLAAKRSNPR